MVNRIASRYCTGIWSRASFMMKKELPQIKAAINSMGLASFLMVCSLMFSHLVIAKELLSVVE